MAFRIINRYAGIIVFARTNVDSLNSKFIQIAWTIIIIWAIINDQNVFSRNIYGETAEKDWIIIGSCSKWIKRGSFRIKYIIPSNKNAENWVDFRYLSTNKLNLVQI